MQNNRFVYSKSLVQHASSLNAAGRSYAAGRLVTHPPTSGMLVENDNENGRIVGFVTKPDKDAIFYPDEIYRDSYGNAVTPFSTTITDGRYTAAKAIDAESEKSQIGYKTDVNTDKDVVQKSFPHNIVTFKLPSYADGITNVQGLLKDSRKPFGDVPHPALDLLPPFEATQYSPTETGTSEIAESTTSKNDENEIKGGGVNTSLKEEDKDDKIGTSESGPQPPNTELLPPSAELSPPYYSATQSEYSKTPVTDIMDNQNKREDQNNNYYYNINNNNRNSDSSKTSCGGGQCKNVENRSDIFNRAATENSIQTSFSQSIDKENSDSTTEGVISNVNNNENTTPIGNSTPFLIRIEDTTLSATTESVNDKITSTIIADTAGSIHKTSNQTNVPKSDFQPRNIDYSTGIKENKVASSINSKQDEKSSHINAGNLSTDIEPQRISNQQRNNQEPDSFKPFRVNLGTKIDTDTQTNKPHITSDSVPVNQETVNSENSETNSGDVKDFSQTQGKYVGGFGGAPGILGKQTRPGYAIQPDGSIKLPKYDPVTHQLSYNAQENGDQVHSPTQKSTDTKPITDKPALLNIQPEKPAELIPYTGGFGGAPGTLGLQFHPGTMLSTSKPTQLISSSTSSPNLYRPAPPSSDILPPIYSNNPFLRPTAAPSKKPENPEIQTSANINKDTYATTHSPPNHERDEQYVHYSGSFGGAPGILG